jgi:hypothetical protein
MSTRHTFLPSQQDLQITCALVCAYASHTTFEILTVFRETRYERYATGRVGGGGGGNRTPNQFPTNIKKNMMAAVMTHKKMQLLKRNIFVK